MTAAKLERALAAAGVPEGADPPYMTTARMMFATLAWRRMDAVPRDGRLDDLAVDARNFVEHAWRIRDAGDQTTRLSIVSDHDARLTDRGGFVLMRGSVHVDAPEFHPSTIRRAPAAKLEERDAHLLEGRAREWEERAAAILRNLLPDDVEVRAGAQGKRRRWHDTTILAVVDGVPQAVARRSAVRIVHDDMDHLLRGLDHAADRLASATERRGAVLRDRRDGVAALADIEERSGLPIRLRIGRNLDGASHPSLYGVSIVMDGYGPAGLATTRMVALTGADDFPRQGILEKVRAAVEEQRELHRIYGPAPRTTPTPWDVDLVGGRLLALGPDGPDTIARALRDGKADDGAGTVVTIAGSGRLKVVGKVGEQATWHGDELRIVGVDLPETIMATLEGRPLTDVVDAPVLRDAGVIVSATRDVVRRRVRLRIKVRPALTRVVGLDAAA